jgi:hypothetical protein
MASLPARSATAVPSCQVPTAIGWKGVTDTQLAKLSSVLAINGRSPMAGAAFGPPGHGGEPSSIDSTLALKARGADLWLLNLAGILFGPR